jgi:hypothetical protein
MTLAPLKTAADRQLEDTRILQKVNGAHREAFREKYPGQVEHCLRLVMERLHAGLDKRAGVDVTDPNTWRLAAGEIAAITEAAERLHRIRQDLDRNA